MKKLITCLFTLCLLTAVAPGAAAYDLGGTNISDIFGQLQQQLHENGAAMEASTQRVEELQAKQKEVANYLNQAQSLQDRASQGDSLIAPMPGGLQGFLDENGLDYPRSDDQLDADGWGSVIQSLQSYQEDLGSEIQSGMKDIQDLLGSYNASTQDVSDILNSLPSTARGQSLFATGGVTAAVFPIVTSLLAGVALGMLTMWAIQRSKRRREKT